MHTVFIYNCFMLVCVFILFFFIFLIFVIYFHTNQELDHEVASTLQSSCPVSVDTAVIFLGALQRALMDPFHDSEGNLQNLWVKCPIHFLIFLLGRPNFRAMLVVSGGIYLESVSWDCKILTSCFWGRDV